MQDNHIAECRKYLADAAKKLAELPARKEAAAKQAATEGRQPYEVRPLTEVKPAVLKLAIAEIDDKGIPVPDDLAETVGVYRRVCNSQNEPFAGYSDQIAAVLALAGIK